MPGIIPYHTAGAGNEKMLNEKTISSKRMKTVDEVDQKVCKVQQAFVDKIWVRKE